MARDIVDLALLTDENYNERQIIVGLFITGVMASAVAFIGVVTTLTIVVIKCRKLQRLEAEALQGDTIVRVVETIVPRSAYSSPLPKNSPRGAFSSPCTPRDKAREIRAKASAAKAEADLEEAHVEAARLLQDLRVAAVSRAECARTVGRLRSELAAASLAVETERSALDDLPAGSPMKGTKPNDHALRALQKEAAMADTAAEQQSVVLMQAQQKLADANRKVSEMTHVRDEIEATTAADEVRTSLAASFADMKADHEERRGAASTATGGVTPERRVALEAKFKAAGEAAKVVSAVRRRKGETPDARRRAAIEAARAVREIRSDLSSSRTPASPSSFSSSSFISRPDSSTPSSLRSGSTPTTPTPRGFSEDAEDAETQRRRKLANDAVARAEARAAQARAGASGELVDEARRTEARQLVESRLRTRAVATSIDSESAKRDEVAADVASELSRDEIIGEVEADLHEEAAAKRKDVAADVAAEVQEEAVVADATLSPGPLSAAARERVAERKTQTKKTKKKKKKKKKAGQRDW